jgi:alkylated DNA repair dioxygenase AlkB
LEAGQGTLGFAFVLLFLFRVFVFFRVSVVRFLGVQGVRVPRLCWEAAVVSYGWRYNFSERAVQKADAIPPWVLPLRETAAEFAGVESSHLQQVLVTEYAAGAAIGWHRDKTG